MSLCLPTEAMHRQHKVETMLHRLGNALSLWYNISLLGTMPLYCMHIYFVRRPKRRNSLFFTHFIQRLQNVYFCWEKFCAVYKSHGAFICGVQIRSPAINVSELCEAEDK